MTQEDMKTPPSTLLPNALEQQYPTAAQEWGWQFVFPAAKLSTDPRF